MKRNRYEQIEHITPCQCEDCGGEPDGWDESWSHCPYHGTQLVSMADLEEKYGQVYERPSARKYDMVGAVNGMLGGVARW